MSSRQRIDSIWLMVGAFILGCVFLIYGITQNVVVVSGIGVALIVGGILALISLLGLIPSRH